MCAVMNSAATASAAGQMTEPGRPPLATTGRPPATQARMPPRRLDTSRPCSARREAARADRTPERHTAMTGRPTGSSRCRWPS
jgi:hypothetical protein